MSCTKTSVMSYTYVIFVQRTQWLDIFITRLQYNHSIDYDSDWSNFQKDIYWTDITFALIIVWSGIYFFSSFVRAYSCRLFRRVKFLRKIIFKFYCAMTRHNKRLFSRPAGSVFQCCWYEFATRVCNQTWQWPIGTHRRRKPLIYPETSIYSCIEE